ncbi:glycine cleavage system aminomethyltransferase GcvT [Parahaliea mediterranea]|uniref:glycine cleavage system aminomethyltransferase GcvT n=1 Tax=Parahaliea mediterranea TaxID=651086 RepID=UPI000E2F9AB1|nr:glycine cleavage system aminomethyltransferase GcvT [Parahaliea mediterranea]
MTESAADLLHTPLFNLHGELGGKMVPFAGYAMPVQYPMGVKKEHLHTREQAGLFDVSHMGQLLLHGAGAAAALEALVPVDIVDLPVGKQRYALFTNDAGGLRDDLMVTNFGDCLYLVVNAACKAQDIAHLEANLPGDVRLERLDERALIALQGPAAGAVMAQLAPDTQDMVFMDARRMTIAGQACFISRSGYTGEDGFEISIPAEGAEALVRELLAHEAVAPIGLGARDSLRLEAGLCLYGHDIDTTTTPVEASLLWAISKARRADGERPGGFPGADVILEQIATKAVARKRVGLVGEGRAPVREGTELFDADGKGIGRVTSGTFGPSAELPVALAYVESTHAAVDTTVYAEVRGKRLPMTVSRTPFVPQRYHRG